MNNKVEIYVNGPSSGTTIGQIELYGDEPISLTYSITDIKDITKRNSTYSQSFTVPATKNNNILFNHIFNIGSDSSFDPSKKTSSYLLVDSLMVIQGNLQLTNIKVKNKNVISYDVVIYGEAVDLVKTLGEKELTDLDFSELNHTYNTNNIQHSWSANTSQLGYYYPLIDYGYDLSVSELNSGILSVILYYGYSTSSSINTLGDTLQTWNTNSLVGYEIIITEGVGNGQVRTITANTLNTLTVSSNWSVIPDTSSKYQITKLDTTNPYSSTGNGLSPLIFKPAISNTYLFKKIINNIGFSIENDFVDSEEFAQTIIPFNGNVEDTVPNDYINSISFRAGMSTLSEVGGAHLNNTSTLGYFDNGNLYNTTGLTGTYTADAVSSQDFVANVKFQYNIVAPFPDICTFRFYRSTYLSGLTPFSTVSYPLGVATTNVYEFNAISDKCDNPLSTVGLHPIQVGESVWVGIDITQGAVFTPSPVLHIATCYQSGTYWYNRVSPQLVANGELFFDKFIPKKIKQIDLIKSYINKFNLMVIPSKNNPKNISFIPRQEYYANGEVKDWTNKLDVSTQIEESVISEQQSKQIIFADKADKDYYNTYYTDDTNKIYGEYIQNIDNEWLEANSKQTITSVFSPTPSDTVFGTVDIVVPKIGKRENSGAFGRTESNVRFLRKNQNLKPTISTIKLDGGSAMNFYPYAGHLDDPFNSVIDYNWGTIDYAFYNTPNYSNLQSITQNNLVNLYWKEYLDDISDKNSKLIKCKIHLTPVDIAQFNYNDSIYIEGLTDDGGHYFIVNKITYIPTTNEPSIVELIKVNRKPTEKQSNTELLKNSGAVKRNVLSLGGAEIKSKNSLGIGSNIFISEFSDNSSVIGSNNYVGRFSSNTIINGNNNIIGNNTIGSYIVGNNNQVGELTTTDTTATTATTMVYISGVTLLGVNNYTATTSDTVYVPNIQFTTSAGTINGVSINTITTGSNLWASGTGVSSIVQVGGGNTASGLLSVAEGGGTIAFGMGSHAEGAGSESNGNFSHAEGNQTTAIGNNSHAEGQNTTASGTSSHSEGYYTVAEGTWSHAEGGNTSAIGGASHSEGYNTTALGNYSHSEGESTIASGPYSHAEGYATIANNDYAHAEGNQTTASGYNSHAEGSATKATGGYSHSEGKSTTASGDTSHAGGDSANAYRLNEWARAGGINSQYGILSYFAFVTNATPTEIFLGQGAGSKRFNIETNSVYKVKISGVISDGSNAKEVEAVGLIKNVSGTVSLVGTFPTTSVNGDAALALATITVTADNTNKALSISVTGLAVGTTSFSLKAEYIALH